MISISVRKMWWFATALTVLSAVLYGVAGYSWWAPIGSNDVRGMLLVFIHIVPVCVATFYEIGK